MTGAAVQEAGDMKATQANCKKLVVVIDNHPLVLDATESLFRSWGCRVVAAGSFDAAMGCLAKNWQRPDLIVCDYQLSEGATGLDAIERLREAFGFEIPALIISGDAGSISRQITSGAYHLLHKPVNAERIRDVLVKTSILQLGPSSA